MQTALRTLLWLVLGGWLGSWVFFAIAVAPTAFRVLPSAGDAGQLVGPLLRSLHLYGMLAGVVAAAAAAALGRGRLAVALPAAMALVCAVSEFGVSAAIAGVTPGPGSGLAADPEAAARFRVLHQASVALFSSVLLATLALMGLHAREEALDASRGAP